MKKIFFIGMHKTGTSTITKTLNANGLNCLHNPLWMTWSKQKDKIKLNQYDVYSDGWTVNYQWLDSEFDAWFVLNTRNLKSWLISRWNHRNRRNKQPEYLKKVSGGKKLDNSEHAVIEWILERNEYHKHMIQYFSKKPNFMTLDIEKEPISDVLTKLSLISNKKITSLVSTNLASNSHHYVKLPTPVLIALNNLSLTEKECSEFYLDRL